LVDLTLEHLIAIIVLAAVVMSAGYAGLRRRHAGY
jgi:hypothetical protein